MPPEAKRSMQGMRVPIRFKNIYPVHHLVDYSHPFKDNPQLSVHGTAAGSPFLKYVVFNLD